MQIWIANKQTLELKMLEKNFKKQRALMMNFIFCSHKRTSLRQ